MTTATHERRRFPVFWIVIALVAIGLGLFAWQASQAKHALVRSADGAVIVADRASRAYLDGLKPMLAAIDGSLGGEARDRIAARIDEQVDAAFAPVYARTDDYLDFHYSLKGEYSTLAATLAGRIGDTLQERLFDAEALDAALARADRAIAVEFDAALAASLADVSAAARRHLPLAEPDLSLLERNGLIRVVRADTLERFELPLAAARTAGAVAGSVTILRAARGFGRRVARRVAAKAATKGAGRLTGGGSAAGAGAAAGSALGPVGTVIGGAAGALAGWLATDKAVIELDEALNRDQFARDLTTLIDGQRAQVKADILARYDTLLDAIATDQKRVFVTPARRFLTGE